MLRRGLHEDVRSAKEGKSGWGTAEETTGFVSTNLILSLVVSHLQMIAV
jgi:hypothetical protein